MCRSRPCSGAPYWTRSRAHSFRCTPTRHHAHVTSIMDVVVDQDKQPQNQLSHNAERFPVGAAVSRLLSAATQPIVRPCLGTPRVDGRTICLLARFAQVVFVIWPGLQKWIEGVALHSFRCLAGLRMLNGTCTSVKQSAAKAVSAYKTSVATCRHRVTDMCTAVHSAGFDVRMLLDLTARVVGCLHNEGSVPDVSEKGSTDGLRVKPARTYTLQQSVMHTVGRDCHAAGFKIYTHLITLRA